MLYQRNMYPLAIELAQNSGMSNEQQSLIYRKFGDHLYQKSDYDGAMNQYIRAIDATEPSQVIRKVRNPDIVSHLCFSSPLTRPVSGYTKNTQSDFILGKTASSWESNVRSHNATAQLLCQIKGYQEVGRVHYGARRLEV